MAQHAVLQARRKLATSGKRWSARLEWPARQRNGEAHDRDRTIDDSRLKLQRDGRRCGSHRIGDGARGDADRAEIIAKRAVAMGRRLAVIGGAEHGCDQAAVGNLSGNVNVAKGYGKVDGNRDQREP